MTKKEDIRMLEGCMKAFVLEHLRSKKKLAKTHGIISEFPINLSARRVDLVTVGEHTHAFEIKSEADSLYRLHGQVEAYLQFFDKVTVVAAPKHIDHVIEETPSNVAVWELHNQSIRVVRRGRQIPIQDPEHLTRLMRVPDLAKAIKLSGGKSVSGQRSDLTHQALDLPITILRKVALAALKERYAKTTGDFWKTVGRGVIKPEHLVALSPTSKEKEAMVARQEAQSKVWNEWVTKSNSVPDDVFLHHLMKSGNANPFGPVPTKIKKLVEQG